MNRAVTIIVRAGNYPRRRTYAVTYDNSRIVVQLHGEVVYAGVGCRRYWRTLRLGTPVAYRAIREAEGFLAYDRQFRQEAQ